MSQKNETLTLVLALLITAALLGGGFWWFTRGSGLNPGGSTEGNNKDIQNQEQTSQTSNSSNQSAPATSSSAAPFTTFAPPKTVPSGTTVKIDGATSMVLINQALKSSFEAEFPGTVVDTKAAGTNNGIQALQARRVDIAAISRPLTSQEQSQGLVAVPVTKDAIAIVIGVNNPFRRGLTNDQVVGIFRGKITDWSAVGGQAGTIRVLNRPAISGTHQAFRELVLNGGNFGSSPNIKRMQRDATTPMINQLNTDGISYATFAQAAAQSKARIVAVNGLTPEAQNYPYQRTLYYAYKKPASRQVEAFLGYVGSSQGQQALSAANK